MEHNSVCLLRKLRKIVKKKKTISMSLLLFLGYFGHFVGFGVILVIFRF